MPRWARIGLLAWGVAALAGACTAAVQSGPEPFRPPGEETTFPANADLGRRLYDQDCAWCHGAGGQGTSYGPNLDGELDGGAYTDFMLRSGRMPLLNPRARAQAGPSRYTEAEIAAIVSYVETFGGTGPPVAHPNPAAGDLQRGGELYLENCAACHSTTGSGGALTSGQVVPGLTHATPQEVAEAMLVGPGCPNRSRACGPGEGAMPSFRFTQDEVDSITRYVQYLQDPEDRGGSPLLHLGPVAEGAVALIVGLGLLVLGVRWIGTRTGEEEG
ncbi:MAG TPA: c-type cytochrome [Actinomycetota bacterium]|jgi:ubiquinol-cytochrome c reductase cytochrome c subunit|nr:c-type cytochrome [Actinomycetota bacterium]